MMMEQPGFWDDVEVSQGYMREMNSLKAVVNTFSELSSQYEDILTMIELGYEENDASILEDLESETESFKEKFEELRIGTLLSGEYDKYGAILTLHAGAGGTESCDWTSMLYRMYQRYADKKGFSVEVLDYLDGEEAGIKSVTVQINGENAYG